MEWGDLSGAVKRRGVWGHVGDGLRSLKHPRSASKGLAAIKGRDQARSDSNFALLLTMSSAPVWVRKDDECIPAVKPEGRARRRL